MKKIIIVNTSPRPKGNCKAITDRLVDKLEGADVEVVDFKNADINYCHGCDACKRMDTVGCVQKDDMTALLPRLDACDGLILLSPIYWDELSAQAKTFVDRLYAFFNPAKENMTIATKFGKKVAIVTTNGGGDAQAYADKMGALANGGMKVAGFTEGVAAAFDGINAPGSVVENAGFMDEVDELAVWMLE